MPRRPPARTAAVVVVAVVLASCGRPALDRQQREASARECASLLERNLANNKRASVTLDGEKLSLGPELYSQLESLRPPSLFSLDDPKALQYGPHTPVSDYCKDKASLSKPAGG